MTDVCVLERSPAIHIRDAERGTWGLYTTSYGNINDPTQCHVLIKCPLCSDVGNLRDALRFAYMKDGVVHYVANELRADGTHGHDIHADGTVMPSIVCPNKGACSWHVYGRLKDWDAARMAL